MLFEGCGAVVIDRYTPFFDDLLLLSFYCHFPVEILYVNRVKLREIETLNGDVCKDDFLTGWKFRAGYPDVPFF
jgi:hypothetical protein